MLASYVLWHNFIYAIIITHVFEVAIAGNFISKYKHLYSYVVCSMYLYIAMYREHAEPSQHTYVANVYMYSYMHT